jgi:hypothetical protein
MQSNQIQSVSIVLRANDRRCKYWAKCVRAGALLPLPEAVSGAGDVPGEYLRSGSDVELDVGDFLLEGEENHHIKKRGWTYNLSVNSPFAPGKHTYIAFDSSIKTDIKDAVAAGNLDPDSARLVLRGSGEVAAMVRAINYYRARNAAEGSIAGHGIAAGMRALIGAGVTP